MTKDKKYTILALDVSSSTTGYAVIKSGRWTKSESSYGIIKTSKKEDFPKRLVDFRNQLHKLIKRVKPTHIIIEDVFKLRNVETLKLLARFSGVAVELSRRCLRKNPTIVMTTKVRSHLECGKSKEEAFEYICDRYNLDWPFSMNDITDALCLALYQNDLIKGII